MSDALIREVKFNNVTADEIGAWLRFDTLMSQEAPLSPFQLARTALNRPPPGVEVRLFICLDPQGEVAAEGRLVMVTIPRQQHCCQIHISVHPSFRRRGIAHSMLWRLLQAAEMSNRTSMTGWTTDRVEAGLHFAKALGASPIDELILQRIVLAQANQHLLTKWTASDLSTSGDYRLQWVEGPYTASILSAIFDLRSQAQTVYEDELLYELPATTLEGMQLLESWWPAERRRWSLIVYPRRSEELIGFTEVNFRGCAPESVYQAATIVRSDHRGLGIARWLKAAMMQKIFLDLPTVRELHAGNASWNDPILNLNRALGFTPWVKATAWHLDVVRARVGCQSSVLAAN